MESQTGVGKTLAGIAAIREMFRDASCTVFSVHGGADQVVVQDIPHRLAPVFGHRMCLLLLGNSSIRVTFKVFFSDLTVRRLMSHNLGRSERDLPLRSIIDFMREFTNQTCGSAKAFLSSTNVCVAMGLPVATRAFDEVLTPAQNNRNILVDWWSLVCDEGEVVCSTMIEVLLWDAVDAITWSRPSLESDDSFPLEILT